MDVALTVEHPEADRLARELAEATGEPLDEAVVAALRERLERRKSFSPADPARVRRAFDKARERLARYPVLDDRSDDELVGDDPDTGLWR